jgi:hypothetical protein
MICALMRGQGYFDPARRFTQTGRPGDSRLRPRGVADPADLVDDLATA